jgi:hypothetical protein
MVRRSVDGELLLLGKSGPRVDENFCSEGFSDLPRPIGALSVDNHHLVRPRNRSDGISDILLFVQGDYDGGDLHAEIVRGKIAKEKSPRGAGL